MDFEKIKQFKNREVKAKQIFEIHLISKKTAYEFVRKHHYLGDKRFFSKFAYGLYCDNELVGVSTFSNPQGIGAIKGWIGENNQCQYILELSRLVVLPILNGSNATSFLLSNSIKRLKLEGIKIVITLADSSRHVGSIYQVCNFRYFGLTEPKKDFWTEDGRFMPRGSLRDIKGVWVNKSRKHRYAYLLDHNIKVLYSEQEKPNDNDIIPIDCCGGTKQVYNRRFDRWYTCPICYGELRFISEGVVK